MSAIRFDAPDLIDVLETLDADGLDALEFGVVAMAPDGVVVGYNTAESALSGLAKERVIGRHFFSAVAPCTNNFMVSHRYETETVLDRTIDYVFTLRMKPRKVKLRMLKRAVDVPGGARIVTDRDDPAQAYEELLQFFYLCPVGIVKFAPDGRIDMVNPLAAQLLMPLTRDAELENIFTVLSDWVPELPVLVRDFGADAGMLFEQRRVATGAGPRQRVLSMTVNRIARPTFMAVIQDVTDAALKERRIHEDQQRFRAIFDQIQDYAIYTLDLEGRIVDWNRTLQRLGGWTAEDVVGKHVSIFFPPSEFDANASGQVLTRAARRGSVEIEGRRVRKDGSEYWGDAVVTALPDKDGNVTGFVVISRDISEQKKREDELLRMATTDPLTGAFNRRYAGERLAEAFDRHKRYANPATAMMIDIDHFKKVNDTYGHDAGDIMLQGLAQLLLGQLRGADMVARWGGEEFLVLMPETRAEPAAVVASRILAAVRATPFVLADGRSVSITVSIGMASLTPEIASGDELVKRADNALYEAKSGGRDRLVSA